MIFPIKNRSIQFGRIIFFLAGYLVNLNNTNSQNLDSTYNLSPQISFGPSFAIGSFSGNSSTNNAIGKNIFGFDLRLDVQKFIQRRYGISLGLNLTEALINNTSIDTYVRSNHKVINSPTNTYMEVIAFGISLGFSRVFKFDRIIVEPKLRANAGYMGFLYNGIYDTFDTLRGSSFDQTRIYTARGGGYVILIPELDFKYLIAQKRRADLALHLGISYTGYNPTITVMEKIEDPFNFSLFGNKTAVTTFKDQMRFLHVEVGFAAYFKKRRRYR